MTFGCFLAMQVLAASAASQPDPSPSGPVSAAAPAATATGGVDTATAAYYRQALPDARRFIAKSFDAALLSPADRGNTAWLQALDASGHTVGYIREFTGPVSTAGLCPCNPLAVTLVFAPDLALVTVLTRAPLQKYGHAPMTPDEQEHMIAIAKSPPPELLRVARGEELIDVTTGATRRAYAPMVVNQAALSTQRLVGIVADTRNLLRGAPGDDDRRKLGALLAENRGPLHLAQGLSALLPHIRGADLRVQAYHYLASTWLEALKQGAVVDPSIEARLLDPELAGPHADDDIAQACYAIADADLRSVFVRRCIKSLETSKVSPPFLALLGGTERFFSDDMGAAYSLLRQAAGVFRLEQVPFLHWRLAKAALATQRRDVACRIARDLFVVHPMLPKLSEVMAACDDGDAQVEALREKSHQVLLRSRHAEGPVVGPVAVRDARDRARKLPLYDAKKATVAVFFATWCPHCRQELPRINAYVAALGKQDGRVQVVGVRTAIDKETQPYPQFLREMTPKFPIYSDQPDSSAFAAFAKAQNLPMALPCVAVIDKTGVIRYLLEPGDWRDTERELAWAVESLE